MLRKELIEAVRAGTIDAKTVIETISSIDGLNRQELAKIIFGVEPSFIIQEMFMGYKQRKQRKQLYSDDSVIPTTLITMYYELGPETISFESLKNAFVSRYIKNESRLEEVHEESEIEGLREMYRYIHSDESDYLFNVYTLKDMHEKLYSKTPHPEFGGNFRRHDVYLPGTGTEICEWSMIRYELDKLDWEVCQLYDLGKEIKDCGDASMLLQYLDECVVLGCKLIKIHPFGDGNGRTVRGFINKLLETAGLPPIYITANERTEYHKAMNKANNEGDYVDIKNFYRYKVCDSIVELDINPRLRKNNYSVTIGQSGKVKQKSDDLKVNNNRGNNAVSKDVSGE